ncbi:alpha/beta hydrolase [Pusillimonas sp. CC-YST705]|uniref:Alpha/beta hydrolase n=1 Tax=Mesopusillimonas faecipullorum TaxID=2755040 RepID=A0ABS8C8E8_9BURK|nr:alpha/beta hydrolase [Mesopusillimonas faecipullorum]MCB5362292.1 alpha/beta hydrolase [Mesopusillimonas faecipullorum]
MNKMLLVAVAAVACVTMGEGSQALAAEQAASAPKVWLDYDQAGLDKAYDQAQYAPNIKQVVKRYGTRSERARERLGEPKRVSYGDTEVEGMDVFLAPGEKRPMHVFLHGGAWRSGLAKDYAFLAEPFVRQGVHFFVPDFVNVTQTDGDLMPLAEQTRRAVEWAYKNAESLGGDPNRLYLSGHSSGAHLAGVVLTTDWSKYGLPDDVIKGAVLVSGMYDLKAPRLSARSGYVRFTDQVEEALSPQRHLQQLKTPVVLVYGDQETPEFIRQSKDFAAALKAAGKPVKILEGKDFNHFEIIETMADPYGVVGAVALEQVAEK